MKIGDFVLIKENCEVGDNVVIKNFVRLASGTKIGNNTVIDSFVRSSGNNNIGNRVTLRYGSTIAKEVTIEDDVFVSPNVMTVYSTHTGRKIGGIVIGKGSFIGTNAVIGAGVQLGANVIIGAMAFINRGLIGDNCTIHSMAMIGVRGLNVGRREDGSLYWKRKAKGTVILEKNVFVGAGTLIQSGFEGATIIGEGTVIGPNCSIGHETRIGRYCLVVTRSSIAGNVCIGDYSRVSMSAIVRNRVNIGSKGFVGMGSLVTKDIREGVTVLGHPAVMIEKFKTNRKLLKKLLEATRTENIVSDGESAS